MKQTMGTTNTAYSVCELYIIYVAKNVVIIIAIIAWLLITSDFIQFIFPTHQVSAAAVWEWAAVRFGTKLDTVVLSTQGLRIGPLHRNEVVVLYLKEGQERGCPVTLFESGFSCVVGVKASYTICIFSRMSKYS